MVAILISPGASAAWLERYAQLYFAVPSEHRSAAHPTTLRYTFPQELAALLHHNNFSVVRRYGDWDGEPLTASSPSIIVVCRKRA